MKRCELLFLPNILCIWGGGVDCVRVRNTFQLTSWSIGNISCMQQQSSSSNYTCGLSRTNSQLSSFYCVRGTSPLWWKRRAQRDKSFEEEERQSFLRLFFRYDCLRRTVVYKYFTICAGLQTSRCWSSLLSPPSAKCSIFCRPALTTASFYQQRRNNMDHSGGET